MEDYALRTGKLNPMAYKLGDVLSFRLETRRTLWRCDRGQYKLIESNRFRSILTGVVSVICSQRPTFQPEAVNDDHRSRSQDIVFDSVSNYYLRVKNTWKTAIKKALFTVYSWVKGGFTSIGTLT